MITRASSDITVRKKDSGQWLWTCCLLIKSGISHMSPLNLGCLRGSSADQDLPALAVWSWLGQSPGWSLGVREMSTDGSGSSSVLPAGQSCLFLRTLPGF